MIRIELRIKGTKGDIIIKGSSIREVLEEYEANIKTINETLGEVVAKPELKKSELVKGTLQGRIGALKQENFFSKPKTAKEVKGKLKEKGYAYSIDRVSIALIRLVRKKYLRRLAEDKEGKHVYVYVNP